MTDPFNPLAKRNLAESTVTELLRKPARPLPPHPFDGAGIYAIYYTGSFPDYTAVARENAEGRFALPIYVGKAVPSGARKGAESFDAKPGRVLFKRLSEHAKSIEAADNLQLSDFAVRWLSVDDVFITLGESLLITRFRPLWNLVVEGFGNHAVGGGRVTGAKPSWDVLHPGRSWALSLSAKRTVIQIRAAIAEHFKT